MGTLHSLHGASFVLRRQDVQRKFDIAAIAGELAHYQTGDARLRILFDWSQVQCWPFEAPSAAALQAWSETTPLIARAAIVHGHKWSRHAALIAALLRMHNAEVRSFRPSDYDRATAWLASPKAIRDRGGSG